MQPIIPCLWFDDQAEEAVRFYTAIFSNSKIVSITRYSKAGQEVHGKPVGSVMTVEFELNGQFFTALNGGPHFKFNEAISFQVMCESQEEIDEYWDKLTADGGKEVQCGWLTDKYGLSWQITPTALAKWMQGKDPERTNRVMAALMKMIKLDISALQQAYEG